MALAEPPPIAFGATIRRFLPPAQRAALDDVEAKVATNLPPAADRPAIRDAIDGYATELVLGPFLDELLSEPFRSRARERLTRGWEAAVDRPRYGPNGPGVEGFLRRLADLDAAGVTRLAATGVGLRAEDPWPSGLSPEDDDGLRVSSAFGRPRCRGRDPGGCRRCRPGEGPARGVAPRAPDRAASCVRARVVRGSHGALAPLAAPAGGAAAARPPSA